MRALAFVLIACLAGAAPAAADLLVSPLRAVMEEKGETQSFTVGNQSKRFLNVKALWLELEAQADGGYAQGGAGAAPASPYLTVEPAEARLAPGESQTFTLAFKKGVRPPKGESRSHLLFEATAAATSLRRVSLADVPLDMAIGVSAPVIVRRGRGGAAAFIADASLERAPNGDLELHADLVSKGAFSPYGTINVFWRDAAGTEETLGTMGNLAVYDEARRRRIVIPLSRSMLGGGALEVRFTGSEEYQGRAFDAQVFEIEAAE